MTIQFNRRLMRLETADDGTQMDVAQIIERARKRLFSDPDAVAQEAEERLRALVAREAAGSLRELERAILAGLRRVGASVTTSTDVPRNPDDPLLGLVEQVSP
jgi:hypothetical protein